MPLTNNPLAAHPPSLNRREFLRVGLSGFASLSLPAILQARAKSAPATQSKERTAVILVWLRGGISHLESYDCKPNAPDDIRGVYGTIPTNVPGLRLCELLPRHARIADKFTILRSMTHNGGGHPDRLATDAHRRHRSAR